MPQLDRLIALLPKHNAEALLLAAGEPPALVVGGARRPVAKTPLEADQILRLLAEIAPEPRRASLAARQGVRFDYVLDDLTVSVEAAAKGGAIIRISDGVASDSGRRAADAAQAAPAAHRAASPAEPVSPPSAAAATRSTRAAPSTQAGPAGDLERLFRLMVEKRASDLHLSSHALPLLRIDGEMEPIEGRLALEPAYLERIIKEIVPPQNWSEFEKCHDTDFAHEIPGLCRFRANLFMDRKGIGAVFRVIPSKILTVDDLNLSPHIRELARLSKGLVLVTGPTGSGKSTTLTALIDLVNRSRKDHIITIEDPIEFVHENQSCLINQREVGVHTGGFKRALRAALREDPDIVLVGEMRDLETVAIALETAETGHLVFGTLHTTSAVGTIDRLVDQFPPDQQDQIRVMLADSLKAVIAQVLVRRKGGGRIAALEVLMVVPAVANLIREGKTFQIPSVMQTGRKFGMLTMNDALLAMVKDGIIEAEQAYIKAIDKPNLLSAFKSSRIPVDFLAEAVTSQASA